MNRSDLIAKAAADSGLTKADTTRALDAILGTIQTAVAAGEKVTIPGFLTVERKVRAGGERRNPATGATINVPAKAVPIVKAGKAFKDAVAAA